MIDADHLWREYGTRVALHGLTLRVERRRDPRVSRAERRRQVDDREDSHRHDQAGRGRAIVAGFDVARDPLEVKKRIGYVPESAALYESLSARDISI